MKKTLYIILALCMLFTLAACGGNGSGGSKTEPTDAKAQGNGITSAHMHCVCAGKAAGVGEHKACSNSDGWVEIGTAQELTDAIAAASAAKPAYLTLTADIEVDGYLEIAEGVGVYVCLNGKTLTATTRNIGNLSITDCTGTGVWTSKKNYTIKCYSGASCDIYAGGVTASDNMLDTRIFVVEGTADENLQLAENDVFLRLYGGKIYSDHVTTTNGACIWAGMRAMVYLYNGAITGGTVHTDNASADAKVGGNVALIGTNSKMYMYGGEVSGGTMKVNGKDGTTSGGWGGNIGGYRGSLYVYGGVISGGYANGNGGNIGTHNSSQVFYFENCTIKDGKADNFGGNCYFNATRDTHLVNFKNAIVTNGEAGASGGNIFQQASTMVIEGGEISNGKSTKELGGGIAFQGNDFPVTMTGNIKFENNTGSDLLLRKHSSGKLAYLSLAGLTTTTDIKVAGNTDTYVFCEDAPAAHALKAIEGFTLTTDGAKITIAKN